LGNLAEGEDWPAVTAVLVVPFRSLSVPEFGRETILRDWRVSASRRAGKTGGKIAERKAKVTFLPLFLVTSLRVGGTS